MTGVVNVAPSQRPTPTPRPRPTPHPRPASVTLDDSVDDAADPYPEVEAQPVEPALEQHVPVEERVVRVVNGADD